MATLFISDLHLEAEHPEIGEQFLAFLAGPARAADALYILGDLFESWVGDDDPSPYYAGMKVALRELADSGVPVYFMHGNRDFMIGEQFASETGVTLLNDPTPLELHGEQVLLVHGDSLCTDDVEYQQVRAMTRNPEWQAMMLAKPLEERIAFAQAAREQSQARYGSLDEEITDVNQDAVEAMIREHGCDILLHGHTHRPAVHPFHVDGRPVHRIVLGDWYEQGSMVEWDEDGPRLEELPR
ncbi:MAG TPA: UDP-2,3-diacylglucosamine diphosphatase [Woeseiaceae bacterium]|jgi:UDP-2,3-diacylglucosamine hydrolase|nr:UDP-2,3-diacylglucosamine diphosphatase [Woeseiaceae bacterium]